MSLSTAIPQLFYDLIGRIIPGTVIFGCGLYVIQGKEDFINSLNSGRFTSFAAVGGILFISYVLGALLGGIWLYITSKFLSKGTLSEELKNISPKISKNENSIIFNNLNFVALVYDYILLWNPTAGARMAKLSAEQHMCGVVLVGSFILSIINLYISKFSNISTSVSLLLSGIASLILYFHLRNRFSVGIKNLWALAQLEEYKKPHLTEIQTSSISLNK